MDNSERLLDFKAASNGPVHVVGLTAFHDNYIWLIHDGNNAVVVDPGDANPVRRALDSFSLKLDAILVTHHHPDHVGGLSSLLEDNPDISIFGPAKSSVPQINRPLQHGDSLTILEKLNLTVIDVPGHTLDHIAYATETTAADDNNHWLFCGDTLFAGGCGRIFEGTPAQMYESLQRLASLQPTTKVFCAHEYTTSNLDFAAAADPTNKALHVRRRNVDELRTSNRPTVPSLLGDELETNPFLRCDVSEIRSAAQNRNSSATSSVDVFAEIRQWKDSF